MPPSNRAQHFFVVLLHKHLLKYTIFSIYTLHQTTFACSRTHKHKLTMFIRILFHLILFSYLIFFYFFFIFFWKVHFIYVYVIYCFFFLTYIFSYLIRGKKFVKMYTSFSHVVWNEDCKNQTPLEILTYYYRVFHKW